MSLGGQMVVITVAFISMGLFIYGLVSLVDSKTQNTVEKVAYNYRTLGVSGGSAQSLPTYTPSVHRTTYSAPVVSPTPATVRTQFGHSLDTRPYRVHERRFTQAAYSGGNGSGYSSASGTTNGVYTTSSVRTGSVSFSVPTLAMSSSRLSRTTALEESLAAAGPRRVYGPGVTTDGAGNYWDDEAEAWLPIPGSSTEVGANRVNPETGVTETWNGSEWVTSATEVNNPIGSLPALLFLLFCVGYVVRKRIKSVQKVQ